MTTPGRLYALWVALGLHVLLVWGRAWRAGSRARRSPPAAFALDATPLASILIPAWNESTTLAATLAALDKLTYPRWEAIVTAGGPDGTENLAHRECAGRPRLRVLSQPPGGKNAALNRGYAQARGEVVVLLDADCVVEPEWLTHLVAPLTQGYDAALGDSLAATRTWVSDLLELEKIAAYQVHRSTTLNGRAGIALRRAAIERLGGFPEAVTVGVDWDLDQRLTRLGLRKAYAPTARNVTHVPATLGRYLRDQVRWRRAHLQATARFFQATPAGVKTTARALSFYAVALLFFAVPLSGSAHLWLAFWAWVLSRRAGVALAVAAYTRDGRWLRRVWVPPALLVASFLSALVALLTARKKLMHFQGPRPPLKGGRPTGETSPNWRARQ